MIQFFASKDQFLVVGLDRFSYEYYDVREYPTFKEAVNEAAKLRTEAKNNGSPSLTDVYFVFDHKGEMLYRSTTD